MGQPATEPTRSRLRPFRRIALPAAGLVLAGLGALWIERRPLAARFIDDRLAASGVAARYRLADLGPGRQRLADVVVGDPARPDLVADWIETETSIGWHGPRLVGIRAGRVRVRGRLINGHLSLGALDRLLPAGGGGRFAWPALALSIADGRLRLETTAGVVGAALSGDGQLDRDFAGRLALTGARLETRGCAVRSARAVLAVGTSGDRVAMHGPVGATAIGCAGAGVADPTGSVEATIALGRPAWRGVAQLSSRALVGPGVRADAAAAQIKFTGRPGTTGGTLAFTAERVAAPVAVSIARLGFAGRFALAASSGVSGTLVASDARLAAPALARIARWRSAATGSPAGPLLDAGIAGAVRAAGRFGGTATVEAIGSASGMRITSVALGSASGAALRFAGSLDPARLRGAVGSLALAGGGLPEIEATIVSNGRSGMMTGRAIVRPFAAGGASAVLSPVSFALGLRGAWQASTTATLSGPLSGGRLEGLVVPFAVRGEPGGRLLVGERCIDLAIAGLRLGGLTLGRNRWTACPAEAALVVVDRGGLGGGAVVRRPTLAGTIGGGQLALGAARLRLGWRDRRFAAEGMTARLGVGQAATRLAFGALDGRLASGTIAGGFAAGEGRIGTVPLALSDAAGRWSFAGGQLDLAGAMRVADAQGGEQPCPLAATAPTPAPRFCPLTVRDLTLRLVDGRIAATGTLAEPRGGAAIARVEVAHDLASSAGHAALAVPSLTFSPALQPDALTPLTLGVVADLAGTITGAGRIDWNREGVTSSGRFATNGLDLAAALGPVQGIEGAITFTDLLGLVSAPGQVMTVHSINPGVPVENGTVRFHLDPGSRVAIEDARWPFAGGTLTLDPALLDLGSAAERHLTLRVTGIAADRFLQEFDFRNLAATGTFDGVLPMAFDAAGGRIDGGQLAVREGGGTIAYVGELGQKQLGFWGDLAFQALKSLRYRRLSIAMNGPLAGEMLTEVRFAGVTQGRGARSNFLVRRLQRLPFVFNVRIKAPFRGLVDTTSSFGDPRGLIRRNLPALTGGQSVQPPASAPAP